jgi:hypothetical protein
MDATNATINNRRLFEIDGGYAIGVQVYNDDGSPVVIDGVPWFELVQEIYDVDYWSASMMMLRMSWAEIGNR